MVEEFKGSVLTSFVRQAIPNSLTPLSVTTIELANVLAVSYTGDSAMVAGVGLGNMVLNANLISVGLGLASGLDTFVPQAWGAGNRRLASVYLMRARCVTTAFCVVMLPVLGLTETILVATGQDALVAKHAGAYAIASACGAWQFFQAETARSFLKNASRAAASAYVMVIVLLWHLLWVWLFVLRWGWGPMGAGAANGATWTVRMVLMNLMLLCEGPGIGVENAWLLPSRDGLRQWGAYLRVAFPAAVETVLEFWFLELMTFFVGYLGAKALAAQTCMLQVVFQAFVPIMGLASTAPALVGSALGAGDVDRTRRCVGLAIALTLVIWVPVAATLWWVPLATWLAPNSSIQLLLSRLIRLYAVGGIFEGLQYVLGGVLRGLGQPAVAARGYAVVFYGLALPAVVICEFVFHLGLVGVWLCYVAGNALVCVYFGLHIYGLSFSRLAQEALVQMEKDSAALLQGSGAEVFAS
mmetsp:Transcript_36985/g.101798  ORF Transcript_36985/g.101798 Transcript_36985/m.101798 type:complete len:469 (-) Transcript_36985:179-1585(-)